MMIRDPIILPWSDNLLMNPKGEFHPLLKEKSFHLAVWTVSGVHSRVEEFHKRQQTSSSHRGERAQRQPISAVGADGRDGVDSMTTIHYVPGPFECNFGIPSRGIC